MARKDLAHRTAPGIRESGELLGLSLPERTVLESLSSANSPAAVRLLEDVIQARAFAAIVCVCVVNPALVIFAEVVKSPSTLFTEVAG
ncbi:MAG TPA: hypothetical protein VD841_05500 [Arthrobacter sp.]|nr:hypothetical protein [Arthrobacter sp.]